MNKINFELKNLMILQFKFYILILRYLFLQKNIFKLLNLKFKN
jgi:hypothetical protein